MCEDLARILATTQLVRDDRVDAEAREGGNARSPHIVQTPRNQCGRCERRTTESVSWRGRIQRSQAPRTQAGRRAGFSDS